MCYVTNLTASAMFRVKMSTKEVDETDDQCLEQQLVNYTFVEWIPNNVKSSDIPLKGLSMASTFVSWLT